MYVCGLVMPSPAAVTVTCASGVGLFARPEDVRLFRAIKRQRMALRPPRPPPTNSTARRCPSASVSAHTAVTCLRRRRRRRHLTDLAAAGFPATAGTVDDGEISRELALPAAARRGKYGRRKAQCRLLLLRLLLLLLGWQFHYCCCRCRATQRRCQRACVIFSSCLAAGWLACPCPCQQPASSCMTTVAAARWRALKLAENYFEQR